MVGSLVLGLFGGADAGEAVDAPAAESVAGSLEGQHVGVVDDPAHHPQVRKPMSARPGGVAVRPTGSARRRG